MTFPEILAEWQSIQAQIKPLQERERFLRMQLFGAAFPNPREGTNNYKLPNGQLFRGVHKMNRKVEPDAIETVRYLLGASETAFQVDNFLRVNYALNESEYKQAPAEIRSIVDRMLTVKPAMPVIEVIDPKEGTPNALAPS